MAVFPSKVALCFRWGIKEITFLSVLLFAVTQQHLQIVSLWIDRDFLWSQPLHKYSWHVQKCLPRFFIAFGIEQAVMSLSSEIFFNPHMCTIMQSSGECGMWWGCFTSVPLLKGNKPEMEHPSQSQRRSDLFIQSVSLSKQPNNLLASSLPQACLPGMPSCSEFTAPSVYHPSEFRDWRRITLSLPQKTW